MKKIKHKYFKIIILNFIVVVGFISSFIISKKDNIEILKTSVNQTINQKLNWGIKRNSEHQQPDVGLTNQKLLEENEGICLGNKDNKIIYLTFDNGYEAGYTNQILDVLKENEVKATFFITAHYLNTSSDIVERMINEGHIIGNQFPTMVMYHV